MLMSARPVAWHADLRTAAPWTGLGAYQPAEFTRATVAPRSAGDGRCGSCEPTNRDLFRPATSTTSNGAFARARLNWMNGRYQAPRPQRERFRVHNVPWFWLP